MPFRITNMAGCCRAYMVADLGGAHGVARKATQKEFDEKMAESTFGPSTTYHAVTTNGQTTEAKYLEAQGWSKTKMPTGMYGALYLHMINGATLTKYLEEVRKTKAAEARAARRFAAPPPPVAPAPIIPPLNYRRVALPVRQWRGAQRNPNGGVTTHVSYRDVYNICGNADLEIRLNGFTVVNGGMRRALAAHYGLRMEDIPTRDTYQVHASIVQQVARNFRERNRGF